MSDVSSDTINSNEGVPCLAVVEPHNKEFNAAVHWRYLMSCAGVILLAFSLRVPGEEKVYLPFFEDVALPGSCFSREVLGVECLGCGLTRCFVCMAHLDVARAWHFNALGVFLFLFVAGQIPYRIVRLARRK